jgi:hypothetical protein
VSRETLLLMNNVLLVVATGSVLLGTLYPLLIDALGMGKLSVGPPYFNAVFVPVMVPLLILLAAVRWRPGSRPTFRAIALRLRLSLVLAVIAGIALPLLMGRLDTADRDELAARGLDRRQRRVPDHRPTEDPAIRQQPSGVCISRTWASPSSSSAWPWSAATRRKRMYAWSRATRCRSAATFRLIGVKSGDGSQLPGLGGRGRTVARGPRAAHHASRKAPVLFLANADDGSRDRRRIHP